MKIQQDDSILNQTTYEFVWKQENKTSWSLLPGDLPVVATWPKPVITMDRVPDEIRSGDEIRPEHVTQAFFHSMFNGKDIGVSATIEAAAELIYREWFRKHTDAVFLEACRPAFGKSIVILGKWLSSDELLALPLMDRAYGQVLPHAATDEREDKMFVMGLRGLRTDKLIVKILTAKKPQYSSGKATIEWTLKLDHGIKIESSMDWYTYRPELHVKHEVMCQKCRLPWSIGGMDVRYVQLLGPLCGPCRDHYVGDLDVHLENWCD